MPTEPPAAVSTEAPRLVGCTYGTSSAHEATQIGGLCPRNLQRLCPRKHPDWWAVPTEPPAAVPTEAPRLVGCAHGSHPDWWAVPTLRNTTTSSMYQLLQLVHVILLYVMNGLQPYLGPICIVVAWSMVILGSWQVIAATRDSLQRAQTMHRIPCADCSFFTNQAVLKCPLHPSQALSEEAIGCTDFETANPTAAAYQRLKTAD